MNTDEHKPETVMGEAGPDVKDVIELYEETINDFSTYQTLQNDNWDTRHCRWPGQTKDQRKRARANGSIKPFPWEGASDLKVPVVDEQVNFGVALDTTSLSRANLRALPIGTDDLAKAAVVGNFMKWLIHSRLEELREEAELAAQYRHEKGVALLRVGWEVKEQNILQPLKLEELAAGAPELAQAIMGGVMDEPAAELLLALDAQAGGKLSKKRARKMVKELREKGETTRPAKVGTVNRPKLKALAVGEDVFFPASTPIDIQDASAIFERVWLTPAATRAKIATDGWDTDYTNYAADKCVSESTGSGDLVNVDHKYQTSRVAGGKGPDLREGLVEWIYAYQKLSDEEGVTGVYCTIFCPQAKMDEVGEGACAKQGLLPYRHGLYPYVRFSREVISRCALDSRGIPETGAGWQNAIKVEVDSRIDAASLTTCPPRYHPPGREPSEWGPGSSVPARRADEYGYFGSASNPGNSIEAQNTIQKIVRSYNGRPTDELDASEAQVKQRKQVDDFLSPWQRVARMLWSLYQQYGRDEEWFRVIGAPQDRAQKFAKADYSQEYDFYFTFDVLNNDPEQQLNRVEKMGQMFMQVDDRGLFNKGEYMRVMAEGIDPIMAERLIIPEETASNREIKETREDIAQMWSGIDKDAPNNANTQLRTQIIQQWMQGSPDAPATDVQQRMQTDQALQKRIQRYVQQLQFQEQQRKNAVIGRVGTQPAYQ